LRAGRSKTTGQVRSIPTLLYQAECLRGEISAQIIHQQLTTEGHKLVILIYICADNADRILRKVAEIDDAAMAIALEDAASRQGFRPRNALVKIEGECAVCDGSRGRGRTARR
jgi:hypothetical protein